MSEKFYVEPEGLSGPELWGGTPTAPPRPTLVLRKADLPGPYDELLWRVVTTVLAPDDATVERVARAMKDEAGGIVWDHLFDEIRDVWLTHARIALAALADPAETGGAA